MGWKVAPDRFLMKNRRWLPRWRFQPMAKLGDACRLLQSAAPQEYAMGATGSGEFWARVRVADTTGEARESSQARAVTFAVARAIGIEPDGALEGKKR
jgi:hypothetical protein